MDRWYELRLRPGAKPSEIYPALLWYESAHHFWDEPWWPNAFVIRVLLDEEEADQFDLPGIDHYVSWDSGPDERKYGEAWEMVRGFFHTSSQLSSSSEQAALTLVHCFLNARGMSERDEARFAARFVWNRLTIKLRWKLYLGRRWKREQTRADGLQPIRRSSMQGETRPR